MRAAAAAARRRTRAASVAAIDRAHAAAAAATQRTGTAAARGIDRYPAHLALAALAAGLALAPAGGTVALAVAGAATVSIASLAGSERGAYLAVAAALLLLSGAWVGQQRLHAIDAPGRGLEPGDVLDAEAELLERPRQGTFGSAAAIRIVSGPFDGARLHARAHGDVRWPDAARPGLRLLVRGSVARSGSSGAGGSGSSGSGSSDSGSSGSGSSGTGPSGSATGSGRSGFDFSAHLRRRGIAGQLSLHRVEPSGGSRGGLAGLLDVARGRAEAALSAGLPPPEAALARGLVLGQDEAIDPLVRDDFRDSGLAHLLAVSGQNVMLLAALALPFLALAGLGPGGRVAGLLVVIGLYVPLAGGGPSIQRAGVMAAAGLLALAAGRPSSRWYALLLAAVATLALNPRVSGDPGWQLSFAAVAGIILMAPPLVSLTMAGVARLGPASGLPASLADAPAMRFAAIVLAQGVAITVAATLATLPLLAHHFGAVPLVGVPVNLLALPAVAPVMWIGMLQGALGQLSPLPLVGGGAAAVSSALGVPAGLLLGYLAAVAARGAEVAEPVGLRAGAGGVVAAYAALGVLALLLRRAAGALRDGRLALGIRSVRGEGSRGRGRLLAPALAALALLGLSGLAPALGTLPGLGALPGAAGGSPPQAVAVSFLDVGQGDATLIRHPDGTNVLFDAGPPEARVVRLLRRAGIRHLDVLVVTHASRDHHGGLAEVIARLPVRVVLDGADGNRDPELLRALALARSRGARTVPATAGLAIRAGSLAIRVLAPAPRPPGPAPDDPNPRAVVAVVTSGDFDLFLSADAESGALLPLPLPDVETMKVPHHGSADPGLPELLARLRPEVAAIEVGEGNPHGHPAPSTLAALEAAVPAVFRTDRDGTVRVEARGSSLHVRAEGG